MQITLFTTFFWGVIVFLIFFAMIVTTRKLSFPKGMRIATAVITSILTLIALVTYSRLSQSQQCNVAISYPKTGDTTSNFEYTISGIVKPKTARVTVVVRSERDTRWWVQEIVSAIAENDSVGKWSLKIFLGSKEVGTEQNYEIIALATNNSFLFNLMTGRFLYDGYTSAVVPLWNQSDLVIIRRVR